jgi:hypothetical protein
MQRLVFQSTRVVMSTYGALDRDFDIGLDIQVHASLEEPKQRDLVQRKHTFRHLFIHSSAC